MAEAAAVLRNGRRALARIADGRLRGRCRRALDELETTIRRAIRIADQTQTRLAGVTPDSGSRLVSLHDPDARPIRMGRIDRPVEFGYKAQVVDNDDGVILDHSVELGAAGDAPQLAPAIRRVTPDPKAESATSSTATAGTAPASTASTERGPGADTASSPTTWSRSERSPPDQPPGQPPAENASAEAPAQITPAGFSARSS